MRLENKWSRVVKQLADLQAKQASLKHSQDLSNKLSRLDNLERRVARLQQARKHSESESEGLGLSEVSMSLIQDVGEKHYFDTARVATAQAGETRVK